MWSMLFLKKNEKKKNEKDKRVYSTYSTISFSN